MAKSRTCWFLEVSTLVGFSGDSLSAILNFVVDGLHSQLWLRDKILVGNYKRNSISINMHEMAKQQ